MKQNETPKKDQIITSYLFCWM